MTWKDNIKKRIARIQLPSLNHIGILYLHYITYLGNYKDNSVIITTSNFLSSQIL